MNLVTKRERLCRHDLQDLEELGLQFLNVPEEDLRNLNYAVEE